VDLEAVGLEDWAVQKVGTCNREHAEEVDLEEVASEEVALGVEE
jgi:hypothetical protein